MVHTPPPLIWADLHTTLQNRHFDNTFVVGDPARLTQAAGKQAYDAIDMGALDVANVMSRVAPWLPARSWRARRKASIGKPHKQYKPYMQTETPTPSDQAGH